jgi:hypothetical protein
MRMLRELMPPHQGDVAQISRVKEARGGLCCIKIHLYA